MGKSLVSCFFDSQCTVVDRQSLEVLSTYLTDDSPIYYALSVYLFQAKLITRLEDRYVVAPV